MDEKCKKRTSIILLLEHVHAMDELTDSEFGSFIRDYANYVETGFEPVFDNDRSLRMLWKVVKSFNDMNVRKMEKRAEANKRNINRRWNGKKYEHIPSYTNDTTGYEKIPSYTNDTNGINGIPKIPMDTNDTISVSVPVSDFVSESVSEEKENSKKKNATAPKRFEPPTLEESEDYFLSKGADKAMAYEFWCFYGSKGWMVGKNKMQNWHMAASKWIVGNRNRNTSQQSKGQTISDNYDAAFADLFGGNT